MRRAAAGLALVLLAALHGGCATGWAQRPGAAGPPSMSPSSAEGLSKEDAVAPAASAALAVQIEAAPNLRALLERHLDLTRLARISSDQRVTDNELSRLLEALPGQAGELLQTEGFFNPQVTVRREAPAAIGAPERVVVQVEPGPPSLVRSARLEIEGPLALRADQGDAEAARALQAWRDAWPLGPGKLFRNADWSDAKSATVARLRSAGYAAATLSGSTAEVNALANAADLYLVVDSGPLFRRGEIVVQGLAVHERQTVVNLVRLGEGETVTETLLLDAQDRLQKSGLFDRVSVTLEADPARADAARILVQLSERSAQQLTLGVGYSANTGPRLTAEHIVRRVFGYAATARNKAEIAKARQAWDGELSTHHDEGLNRWVTGATVERLVSPSDVVLSQRLKFGRAQDSPRIDRFHFLQLDRSARNTDTTRSASVAASANVHWAWRNIDNPLLPTDGVTLTLDGGGGLASSSDGNHGGFARGYGRITLYRPLGERWYAQARVEAGQVRSPPGLEVPESLRFRAGGDDSVRGYGYRSLGPLNDGVVGSGDVLLTTSLELARPFIDTLPSLWGAFFLDAGNAAMTWRDFHARVGTGVGVRWRSPVGPLRLDLAWAPALQRARLHFSVGIVF